MYVINLMLNLIYSERSPVFWNMFSGDNLESVQNKVTLLDDYAAVLDMIRWMYQGSSSDFKLQTVELQGHFDLYKLSDRYDLPRLTSFCAKLIYAEINVDTAMEIYVIGKVYQDEELVDKSASVIRKFIIIRHSNTC